MHGKMNKKNELLKLKHFKGIVHQINHESSCIFRTQVKQSFISVLIFTFSQPVPLIIFLCVLNIQIPYIMQTEQFS